MTRIPLRCAVVVREKVATTAGETEDVGLRGCRLLLPRPVTLGTILQLRFTPGDGADPLDAVGQVVWASKTAPLSAGVVFVSAPRVALHEPGGNWLDLLVAVQLQRVVRGEQDLGALGTVRLQLHVPPRLLAPHDLAAVRIARAGGTIAGVAASVGGLGPLAGLLERGTVAVARATAAAPGASGLAAGAPPWLTPAKPTSVIVPPSPGALGPGRADPSGTK